MLTLNPELFSITQSKEMGLWPPGDTVSIGVFPYIERLKVESVKILDVGCMKGENAVHLCELDTKKKIKQIDLVVSGGQKEFESVLQENIKGNNRIKVLISDVSDEYDVVCIHGNAKNLPKTMRKYYSKLKSNGIFCGNAHADVQTKVALNTFRREDRIGTPIMVSKDCWFWVKR